MRIVQRQRGRMRAVARRFDRKRRRRQPPGRSRNANPPWQSRPASGIANATPRNMSDLRGSLSFPMLHSTEKHPMLRTPHDACDPRFAWHFHIACAIATKQAPTRRANQPPLRQNMPKLRANKPELRANNSELRADKPELRQNKSELRQNHSERRANQAERRANRSERRANNSERRANRAELREKTPAFRGKTPAAGTLTALTRVARRVRHPPQPRWRNR